MTSAVTTTSTRFVSLDVLRGLAILLMVFSGLLPKTLPNWMDHGYQPHYKPDAAGLWTSALNGGDAAFDGNWKAMTWVDLVFPMFLFSMGAAIPIAMSRRVENGAPLLSLAGTVFSRFVMLMVFALLLHQLNPPSVEGIDDDTRRLFLIAVTGIAFLFFVRWPATVPAASQRLIRRIAGFVLLAIVFANIVQRASIVSAQPERAGLLFAWSNDTIIAVLAYTYLVAGLAWIVTRRWPWLRWLLLLPVMLLAHYIALDSDSRWPHPDWLWMGDWPTTRTLFTTAGGAWTLKDLLQSPLHALNLPSWIAPLREAGSTRPWLLKAMNLSPLYNFTWLKYLWIVVPGTMVGDWLLRRSKDVPRQQWIDPMTGEIEGEEHPFPRWLLLTFAIAATVLTFVGLRNYFQPTLGLGGPMKTPFFALTFATPVIMAMTIVALMRVPRDEWLVRRLCIAGAIFAMVGLVLATLRWPPLGSASLHWRVPSDGIFEGGISKGPPSTLSYYFTSSGLCMLLLAGLFAVIDTRGRARRRVGLIEANGQNPLLVYFLEHLTLAAVLGLAIFKPFHSPNDGSWWSSVNSVDDLGRTSVPWLGALWGAAKTLTLAVFVWLVTRRRIYWRA